MSQEQKPHNPIAIANHFIDLSLPEGLTLMQLLKLSYIAHGFNLALLDKPLADEYAEAWRFGPVFPSIYHEFKYEKPGPIKKKARWADMKRNILKPVSSKFDTNEETIMQLTYEEYGGFNGWQLSAITHAPDTPWYEAWEKGEHIRGYSITNKRIKKYYKDLIKKNQNQLKG